MSTSLHPPHSAARVWLCRCVIIGALLSGALLPGALAYSSGAPEGQCNSMTPLHGQSSRNFPNSYRVTVSSATYAPMQLITVTIEPTRNDISIRGFLLQARSADNRNSGTRHGFFTSGSGTKTVCNSGAITHSYSTDRSSVTASWRAPASPQGDLVFRATVVRRYSDFYTEIYSSVISPQTTTTSTTTTTTSTTTPTTTSTTTPSSTTTTSPPPPPPTTTTSKQPTTTMQATSTAAGQSSPASNDTASGETTEQPTTTTLAEGNTKPTGGAGLARCSTLLFLPLLLLSSGLMP